MLESYDENSSVKSTLKSDTITINVLAAAQETTTSTTTTSSTENVTTTTTTTSITTDTSTEIEEIKFPSIVIAEI